MKKKNVNSTKHLLKVSPSQLVADQFYLQDVTKLIWNHPTQSQLAAGRRI